jgi:hypothetical protein
MKTLHQAWEIVPNRKFGPISLGERFSPETAGLTNGVPFENPGWQKGVFFDDNSVQVVLGDNHTTKLVAVWSDVRDIVLLGVNISDITVRDFWALCTAKGVTIDAWQDFWSLRDMGVAISWSAEDTLEWASVYLPGPHAYEHFELSQLTEIPTWVE